MGIAIVKRGIGAAAIALWLGTAALPVQAAMELTAFKQSVAAEASQDSAIAAFYRDRDYAPFWTSPEAAAHRSALLHAVAGAGVHGLPVSRYDSDALIATFRDALTQRDMGRAEVAAMRLFLAYAQDISNGVLDPNKVVPDIKRKADRIDPAAMMKEFAKADSPEAFLKALPPESPEYARLLREKLRLERRIANGGWGDPVPISALRPGDSGPQVVALRNRLIAMDYLPRTATRTYDGAMQKAVQRFQLDHGLEPDGVAGTGTVAEINLGPEKRLQQVLVAMERERWLGDARGTKHVLVNITDFHARIVEDGEVVFETRSVVGQNRHDQRTPEFSDEMDHMVINPSWHVPRSIAVNEYLPQMIANPGAARHLQLVDGRGRVVSRSAIDFSKYSPRNFPFDLKQPPSQGNALGQVKFMFPNPYNIYLHDTPSQSLFAREVRTFSHGCVRLDDPFDFAYALLAMQTDDPKGFFHEKLDTGREIRVDLEHPLPVHIIYRTALGDPKGRMQYRRDVYGRDKAIFEALSEAGVVLAPVRG
ncbi:murein L,D-transpeptidase YcbB/YkuD [Rhodovulum bhavnagarense]|uniref:Murein L,D-transpeptidase YcbB/YkuD n=1 Tax=Rhodovulum bhavnagarense TaxID=992286 RepID=A0A4R2RL60_9RHOB|nr:L,D-transpeptidase family protein [Rhodovulum bhavnagarense]TCP63339.1 murein L,D-transpeptidase YcbB/YkuD [Rhodovulum bhavnagarense]